MTACSTDVEVSVSFGNGSSWSISSADFKLSRLSSSTCLGAIFVLNSSGSTPNWIFGDTFLVSNFFDYAFGEVTTSSSAERRVFCFPL